MLTLTPTLFPGTIEDLMDEVRPHHFDTSLPTAIRSMVAIFGLKNLSSILVEWVGQESTLLQGDIASMLGLEEVIA